MKMRGTIKPEGGQGGRRGHSNMAHWDKTHVVKTNARKARRRLDRVTVAEQLGA